MLARLTKPCWKIEVRDSVSGESYANVTTSQSPFSVPVSLPKIGSQTLDVILRDVAGNETSFAYSLHIDTAAPYVDSVEVITPEGAPRPSEVVIHFTEAVNLQQLIDSGEVFDAVTLSNDSGVPVTLPSGVFSYDPSNDALHLSLTNVDVDVTGIHTLRLDGDAVTDIAGNALIGGSQLMEDNPLVFSDPQYILLAQPGDSYSVPVMADLNGDGLDDLLVGVKTEAGEGAVRVYYNGGSESTPRFPNAELVQVDGEVLAVPASGCMGAYPRVFDWNRDGLDDLLLGHSDGTISWAENTGTAQAPVFSNLQPVQVGGVALDVGDRATFDVADWNGDGAI